MSDAENEKKVHGMVAEFDSVDTLLAACRRIRDAGYTKTDAFTPFPVHGIDKALGIQPTALPWIALAGGLSGTTIALVMQIWMNAIDYPYIISGKPYISLPAFMPVAFELTILLASFGAFFGMWALNGLPKFSNPMFTNPRFDRATDDTFFLFIDAKDDRYDAQGVTKLLGDIGGQHITSVVEDDSPTQIPKILLTTLATVIGLSIIPALIVAKMRVTTSGQPRFHVFPDMDFSPAKGAQMFSSLFTDQRIMRADVPGTIARGQLEFDMNYMTGIDLDALSRLDSPRAERLVRALVNPQEAQETAVEDDDSAAADVGSPVEDQSVSPSDAEEDTTPWMTDNPLAMTEEMIRTGQTQFNIYCAVCHGLNGAGNGLVNQRARRILAGSWIPPSSMHQETLYQENYPDGKLFSTITNGVRKMPGYGSQIKAADRWAIVAYVRALQQSQNASIDLVPSQMRAEIEQRKNEIKERLQQQAEADRQREEEQAQASGD